jgi:hypothetical protein
VKWFGREPALWLTAALTIEQLAAVTAHLDRDQQNGLSVGVTAVYAVLLAALTRPIDTAALTGGIATAATAAGALGFHVSADWISAFNAALVGVLTIALTSRVSPSPRIDPRIPTPPAGRPY